MQSFPIMFLEILPTYCLSPNSSDALFLVIYENRVLFPGAKFCISYLLVLYIRAMPVTVHLWATATKLLFSKAGGQTS